MNSIVVLLYREYFYIHMTFCDNELHEDHFYFWYSIHEPENAVWKGL